jgi:hypothetical protein
MNLQFTVPPDLSFEQAIALTQELLDSNPPEELLESAIAGLIQTMNGSRGFFVTFLTGDSSLADQPTASILKALRSNPDAIADLMVKNIAMPTAMMITHQRNGNPDLIASSQLTQKRSIHLVQQLNLNEITILLNALKATLQNQSTHYQSFLDRWGYDEEQRLAIEQAIELTLAKASD